MKEKFGTLHVRTCRCTGYQSGLQSVIELQSHKTCTRCSAPGGVTSDGGWYVTLCDRCAERCLQAAGAARETPTVAEILRANAHAEFAGAIRFDTDRTRSAAATSGYERLTETEIGRRLEEADRIARALGTRTRRSDGPEGITLSGMRGKIGLTMLDDGSWGAAQGQALNT